MLIFGPFKETLKRIIILEDNIRAIDNKKDNKKLLNSASVLRLLPNSRLVMQINLIIAKIGKNMQY